MEKVIFDNFVNFLIFQLWLKAQWNWTTQKRPETLEMFWQLFLEDGGLETCHGQHYFHQQCTRVQLFCWGLTKYVATRHPRICAGSGRSSFNSGIFWAVPSKLSKEQFPGSKEQCPKLQKESSQDFPWTPLIDLLLETNSSNKGAERTKPHQTSAA